VVYSSLVTGQYTPRYEKEVEKLQKEAKAYIDSMRGTC
jgi:hypothetical protein